MNLFSQRKGIKPVKTVIQADSIDADLRNGLWSVLYLRYWQKVESQDFRRDPYSAVSTATHKLCRALWLHYFKYPVDTLPWRWSEMCDLLRNYFFSCPWNEVYDFIEFIAKNYPDETANALFRDDCNFILEREVSAYRFVGDTISPITSEEEIDVIEQATQPSDSLRPVAIHLQKALDFLADRKSPDYRNSIKESISGVEAACKLLTGDPKADLNEALSELKKRVSVHPALERAFISMYAYTSDEDGIRHALMDEPSLGFEDAKFMLVSCAAFVNYLRAKAVKAGRKV
jgi:hypothetical protein